MIEQPPSQGVGPLRLKRFAGAVSGASIDAEQLITRLRVKFPQLMPRVAAVDAEAGATSRLYEGATLTMGLPLRGNIQVRVADVQPTEITLLTLRGDPAAGAVRFAAKETGDGLSFEVQVYDRAANVADFALMALGGSALQASAWQDLVRAVLRETGGVMAGEVTTEQSVLDAEQTQRVDRWLAGLARRLPAPARGRTQDQTEDQRL